MAHAIDSLWFGHIFGTPEMRDIFSDRSLLQKWMNVEAALARAEAKVGLIPAEAAREITEKAAIQNIDLKFIENEIHVTKHQIIPVIKALEKACSQEVGEYIHWGATTQDIMDTALVLQLKDAYSLIYKDLLKLLEIALRMAYAYRLTIMPGRTNGQHALPTTFGFKVSIWCAEIARHLERLCELRERLLVGQFCGAVGTLASVAPFGMEIRRLMMEDLGLGNCVAPWTTARDNIAEYACALGLITGTLGKIGQEIYNLQRNELGEVHEHSDREQIGSSTMPHKQNPVGSCTLMTLGRIARQNVPLALESMYQEHERTISILQIEWEWLPEISIISHSAIQKAIDVLKGLRINDKKMTQNIDITQKLIMSERIMMHLGKHLGRQKAHDMLHDLVMKAASNGKDFCTVLTEDELVMKYFSKENIYSLLKPEFYIGEAVEMTEKVSLNIAEQFNITL
ncbi:adenylosuccinate lyase [Desulfocucumis palustris]|uniref:Adenylosuccinate lyase n=1 Tax=Desulfocucumis palustris TaxID=1898651 RepID=A0A2L2X8Y8_9FIRM|nr:adenylosuccinate lyase [Desulfocucumis palustris]GBF32482.1 adenylosuccinate lyase [Desulfocucumis palustris]